MNPLLNPVVIDQLRAEIFGDIANIQSVIDRDKPPIKYPLTDLGNVERFIQLFPDEVCYIPQENDFSAYDDKKWTRDLQGKRTHELVDKTVRSIYGEAENVPDEHTRKQIAKHALRSEAKNRRDAIVNDLKHRLVKSIDEFDRDPWLFNVQNGTIDLKTGKLQQHNRADCLMKISPVTYYPEAKCPLWTETLNLFFRNSKPIIEYIQKLFGYTLCGIKNERLVVFLYGRGRNGKTTLTSTILKIFGDYGQAADISTFIENKWGGRQAGSASEDLARLRGTRYVRATEIGTKDKLNEKLIKDISGGDIITARFLFSRSFDFQSCFTLWFFGNEKIKVEGQDVGIKDRIKFIPLTFEIPKDQEDPSMRDRLFSEEAPGILNWLVEGCLKWQGEGLMEPAEISQATIEFFEEQDLVGLFLRDCCNIEETNSAKYKNLYHAFIEYSDTSISRYQFSKTLEDKGHKIITASRNQRYVMGLSLKLTNVKDRDENKNTTMFG